MTTAPYLALQRDLADLHSETGGCLSVAILDLGSAAAVAVDAARLRPMASVAKWVLAHMAFVHAAQQGASPFMPLGPQEESLAALAKRAIAQHDPDATRLLQAYVPVAKERELLQQLDLGEIQPEADQSLRSNQASSRALVRMLWHQTKGQPTALAAEQLLHGMSDQRDQDGLVQGIPTNWATARMTGGTQGWAAEVGIIYLPRGAAAVAALVERPHSEAVGILTDIGRRMVTHLGAQVFG